MRVKRSREELAKMQVELEMEMRDAGRKRYHTNIRRNVEAGAASETLYNRRVTQVLVDPMLKAVNAYIEHYDSQTGKPSAYLKLVKNLDKRAACLIACKVILSGIEKDHDVKKMLENIGRRIEDQVRFSKLHEQAPKYIEKVLKDLEGRTSHYGHKEKALTSLQTRLHIKNNGTEQEVDLWRSWDIKTIGWLGGFFADMFVRMANINGNPIVEKKTLLQVTAGKHTKMNKIVPTAHFEEWIKKFNANLETLTPAYAPCVIPPVPRTTPFSGGFHVPEIAGTLRFIKTRKSHLRRLTADRMPIVYSAINAFQNVPWRINEDVLNVALKVQEKGYDYGMPQAEPFDIPLSPVPEELQEFRGQELLDLLGPEEAEEFKLWKNEARELREKENSRKAAVYAYCRTLHIAKKYSSFEEFYYVYKMDDRGRVYPVGDSLIPQGNDLQKALLERANARLWSSEVVDGYNSYEWFMIVGAGLWAVNKIDKAKFGKRLAGMERDSDLWLDIAADPFSYKEWLNADKCWGFLAWCCEYSRYQDHLDEGGSMDDYSSHFRGGMDGSCSGLQHYSLMLRDEVCGALVNLIPSEEPNDLYGAVAECAKRKVEGAEESEIRDLWYINMDLITRKMTKKSSMTLTYGSTMSSCRDSIKAYLSDIQAKENKSARAEGREARQIHPFQSLKLNKEGVGFASTCVWGSIGDLVKKPRAAMKFIQKLAFIMGKANLPFEHVMPSGFFMSLDIKDRKAERVDTILFGATNVSLPNGKKEKFINKTKLRSVSAPDFIHGHDASHVALMGDACAKADIELSVIHDDFESHIGDIGRLRIKLRETGKQLYADHNPLERLKDTCEQALGEKIDLVLPELGSLSLDEFLESPYAFS